MEGDEVVGVLLSTLYGAGGAHRFIEEVQVGERTWITVPILYLAAVSVMARV